MILVLVSWPPICSLFVVRWPGNGAGAAGSRPRSRAKLVLVLVQVNNWHPVQRTEGAGAGDPGKVPLDMYPMKSYI